MDRRMIILLIVLGILCFTITLSEDSIHTPVVFDDPMVSGNTHVSALQEPAVDAEITPMASEISVISRMEEQTMIRVVLSKDHAGEILSDALTISWNQETTVGKNPCPAGSRKFTAGDIPADGLCMQTKGEYQISFDGSPDTRIFTGKLYLYSKEQQIYAVNEVSLEEYVACVVPGEMPSYYPGEALKAQAVCARTYALYHLDDEKKYHADVGDTTSWQVYNSVGRKETTDEAVKETEGEVILTGGEPANLYFFSTSCGFAGTDDVWNDSQVSPCLEKVYVGKADKRLDTAEDFAAYIKGSDDAAWEKEEPWFRWHITFSREQLLQLCEKDNISAAEIYDIRITKRSSGFAAKEIAIVCGEKTNILSGEYNIREFFSPENVPLTNQKETLTERKVLPSGYFIIESRHKNGVLKSITLYGGGFGHGAGMSQNGARCMAEAGMSCEEILTTFFDIS